MVRSSQPGTDLPMSKRALTAAQIAALSDHTVHWVAPSQYLQIRPQGTRSWLFCYSRDGGNQWMASARLPTNR